MALRPLKIVKDLAKAEGMEFGKTENLEGIDWNLASDDPGNRVYLASANPPSDIEIFIGAPAWGCKAWVGRLYPPHTKPQDFLYFYSRNFTCIELNTTHYRIPDLVTVHRWREKVPSNFLFCPKFPKNISHERGGLRDLALHQKWQNVLHSFDTNLGSSFLQLPPTFDYDCKAEFFRFIQAWPDSLPLALEFRHPSWFRAGQLLPALADYLRKRRIATVITDVAGRRSVLHSSLTSSFSMLRLIGNNLHTSDFERANLWVNRLRVWQKLGLSRFYFMVHEPDDIQTPALAAFIIQQINQMTKRKISPLNQPLL